MSNFKNGFALVIGIANYLKVRKLPQSVLNDAQDIYHILCSPNHCGYLEDHVQILLDEQAIALRIRNGLRWLANVTSSGDTALIFFSGHGGRVESGPQTGNYLIPYDCNPTDLGATAISGTEFTDLLRAIRAQRLLVLFDSCYSGGTGETKDSTSGQTLFKSGLEDQYYNRLSEGTGRVIIASSRSDEESLILNGMKNSLFTYHLLDALRGKAHTRNDGLIRVFDVFNYVSEAIHAHGPQHPIFKASDVENNFPIALYQEDKKSDSSASPILTHANVDKSVLREAVVQSFSLEELDILCSDIQQALLNDGIKLQVNLEMIGGSGKREKVLNLIGYLERRGYLSYLLTLARQERPGLI